MQDAVDELQHEQSISSQVIYSLCPEIATRTEVCIDSSYT